MLDEVLVIFAGCQFYYNGSVNTVHSPIQDTFYENYIIMTVSSIRFSDSLNDVHEA